LTLATVFVSAATAEDWPRWRGPRGDGVWHAELPERWPDEGLPVAWKQPLGGGYSGIAVRGGRVYTMDRQTQPHEVERLLCFDAKSGDLIWAAEYAVAYNKLDYGNGPRSTPTLHDGRVYTLGAVGHLRCTDAATGKQLWFIDLVAEAGAKIPEWGLAASPIIWNELVIVHPGGNPQGCIMAFNRHTGKEAWRSGDDPAGYATPILIRHAGHEQLICWTPLHVVGLDPATGQQHWSIPYKVTYGVSIATPLFRDGIVFVSGYWEGSKAIRLGDQPQQAELLWEENRHLRGIMSPPIYRDGLVYSLDKQYGLTCFELATGRKLWDDGNRLTPRGRNPQANLVWLGETDRAIALNSEGELILARLTREGFQEQSRVKIIGPTWAHPAFAGNRVYARNDSELVAVELPLR
jgi:outer membrane protein assembly factor BamB